MSVIQLPTHGECTDAIEAGGDVPALYRFIYHNEPGGRMDDAWRESLTEMLEEFETKGQAHPPREAGRTTIALAEFIAQVKQGKRALMIGPEYVTMSRNAYDAFRHHGDGRQAWDMVVINEEKKTIAELEAMDGSRTEILPDGNVRTKTTDVESPTRKDGDGKTSFSAPRPPEPAKGRFCDYCRRVHSGKCGRPK